MAEVTTKLAGQSWGNKLFYLTIRFIVIVICRIYLRLRIVDAHKIPKSGTFILAPSHRSTLDIPVAAATTRRRMMYMGKDSMWKIKPIGVFLTASPLVRAQRRVAQIGGDVEQIARDIAERDHKDTTRSDSPLRESENALFVDTSDRSISDVVNEIVGVFHG